MMGERSSTNDIPSLCSIKMPSSFWNDSLSTSDSRQNERSLAQQNDDVTKRDLLNSMHCIGHPHLRRSPHIFCLDEQNVRLPVTATTLHSSVASVTDYGASPRGVDLLQPQMHMHKAPPLNVQPIQNLFSYRPFFMQPLPAYSSYAGGSLYRVPVGGPNSVPGYLCTEGLPANAPSFPIISSLPSHIHPYMLASACNLSMTGLDCSALSRAHSPINAQKCVDLTMLKQHASPNSPPSLPRKRKRHELNQTIPTLANDFEIGESSAQRAHPRQQMKCNFYPTKTYFEKNFESDGQQNVRFFNDGVEVDTEGNPLKK